jgi:hypothetical protein
LSSVRRSRLKEQDFLLEVIHILNSDKSFYGVAVQVWGHDSLNWERLDKLGPNYVPAFLSVTGGALEAG